MTDILTKLRQKERRLERELDQVERDATQLQRLSEEYEGLFYQTASLLSKMEEQFYRNEFHWSISEYTENLRQRQHVIFNELTDEQDQRRKQKTTITEQQNELFYQRKSALVDEEETNNEY